VRIPRLAVVLLAVVVLSLPIVVSASDGFRDVAPDDVFHDDITWLDASGITRGCNPPLNDLFCGTANVTRNQLSAFLHRLSTLRVVDAASVQGLDAAPLRGQTGAQGPVGPQGVPGLTGPAGTTDHNLLSNIGTLTHAQLDSHVADSTIHRSIDAAATSATALWSAAKIMVELAGEAAEIHSHVLADISDFVSGVDGRVFISAPMSKPSRRLFATNARQRLIVEMAALRAAGETIVVQPSAAAVEAARGFPRRNPGAAPDIVRHAVAATRFALSSA
jgi:hypothetical protein